MQTRAAPGYENVVDSWSCGVIVYSMMTNVSMQSHPVRRSMLIDIMAHIRQCPLMRIQRNPYRFVRRVTLDASG